MKPNGQKLDVLARYTGDISTSSPIDRTSSIYRASAAPKTDILNVSGKTQPIHSPTVDCVALSYYRAGCLFRFRSLFFLRCFCFALSYSLFLTSLTGAGRGIEASFVFG